MIYITQLIYIQEGQESVFNQFESLVLPLLSKHNGKLLLRIRPDDKAYIETNLGQPYEIHLVEFREEKDFENFMLDEERKQFLHLKEQSIKSVWLLKGSKL